MRVSAVFVLSVWHRFGTDENPLQSEEVNARDWRACLEVMLESVLSNFTESSQAAIK
jgi:hypothetical protein